MPRSRKDDFVLVDLWAKVKHPRGVYADYTRVGYVGEAVPEEYEELFGVVVEGPRRRDRAGEASLRRRSTAPRAGGRRRGPPGHRGGRLRPASFNHRTGHNIGQDDHGNGAHLDNLETRDDRLIIRRTCFSIEPGIYLPEVGVRTEVDVYIDAEGNVHVTGGEPQTCVLPILA